jgi:membrane protein DedA with SNARE-associated domain
VIYLLVFLGSLGVDLVPVVAPPAWTLMALLLVKYHLNPWAVLAVGVPGSALGRYIFSLYIPKFSDKLIARRKKEELTYVGKRLDKTLWRTWTFVLVYTLTPLSTTALFTAAGMTKVNPMHLIPPFLVGKFISDAAMIVAGRYAASNVGSLLHGVISVKALVMGAITLIVTAAFLFIDWHKLLVKKEVAFNFSVWR